DLNRLSVGALHRGGDGERSLRGVREADILAAGGDRQLVLVFSAELKAVELDDIAGTERRESTGGLLRVAAESDRDIAVAREDHVVPGRPVFEVGRERRAHRCAALGSELSVLHARAAAGGVEGGLDAAGGAHRDRAAAITELALQRAEPRTNRGEVE